MMRRGAPAARQPHKLEAASSILAAATIFLAGCQSAPVKTCAPVPRELFALPPSAAQPVADGATEEDYLRLTIGGLVEDIEVRDARLRTIRAHQQPCR